MLIVKVQIYLNDHKHLFPPMNCNRRREGGRVCVCVREVYTHYGLGLEIEKERQIEHSLG